MMTQQLDELGEHNYLRFVGVAIATAVADGAVDESERAIIEEICAQVELPEDKRAVVDEMLASPPDEAQIARWTHSDDDRIAVYAIGLRIAESDNNLRLQEARVLDRLRRHLRLTPEEITRAKHQASLA